jgi:hypothetical protein
MLSARVSVAISVVFTRAARTRERPEEQITNELPATIDATWLAKLRARNTLFHDIDCLEYYRGT